MSKERFEEIKTQTGQLFFDMGRLTYQVEQDTQEIADIKIKLHNLNVEAKKLREKMGMEIKLAPAPEAESTQVTQ